jgi:hypothetical protein
MPLSDRYDLAGLEQQRTWRGWWTTLQPIDELNERELGGTIAERD